MCTDEAPPEATLIRRQEMQFPPDVLRNTCVSTRARAFVSRLSYSLVYVARGSVGRVAQKKLLRSHKCFEPCIKLPHPYKAPPLPPLEGTTAPTVASLTTNPRLLSFSNREVDGESEAQEMDYAEQTALIAMRAKLALVNRQIKELSQAKKTIALDHSSANAQLILAEARSRPFGFFVGRPSSLQES